MRSSIMCWTTGCTASSTYIMIRVTATSIGCTPVPRHTITSKENMRHYGSRLQRNSRTTVRNSSSRRITRCWMTTTAGTIRHGTTTRLIMPPRRRIPMMPSTNTPRVSWMWCVPRVAITPSVILSSTLMLQHVAANGAMGILMRR